MARKPLNFQNLQDFLELIATHRRTNVHAGQHLVRPPRAPTTLEDTDGRPAGYGRDDRLTEGVCEIGPILLWRAVGLRFAA